MSAAELAVALEERGLESLWTAEHSHIPLSRQSAFPQGGPLPRKYAATMDPFVTLAVAAGATKRLKIGTSVCLLTQRDVIQTAKLVASIDRVSNGRFLFGIGGGWNAEEMADHGTTEFKNSFRLMRERVEAMQRIWTEESPEYHCELVDLGPMMCWPKPVQRPHPPVIVRGAFPYGARRAIRYGDGWVPHRSRPQYEDVSAYLPQFRQMALAAGCDPAAVPVTLWGGKPDYDQMARYRDIGIARVVASVEPAKGDTVLPVLDEWAAVMRKVTA